MKHDRKLEKAGRAVRQVEPLTSARDIWATAWRAVRLLPYGNARAAVPLVPVTRGRAKVRDAAIREARAIRSAALVSRPDSLEARLGRHIAGKYRREIAARGGETEIETENGSVPVDLIDRRVKSGLVLLGCDAWRHYSRRFGSRPASLRYLCGVDDNGPWAVRVSGTCNSIGGALDDVEPAEVKKARAAGRGVLRQGDIYAVELAIDRVNDDALRGTNHRWDADRQALIHVADDGDAHGALSIPEAWKGVKFVRQQGLNMRRWERERGRDGRD